MITKSEVIQHRNVLTKAGFTRCQIDVLSCLVEGGSNREIGKSLYITEYAVKYHMTNLLKKFEVKNRKQLVLKVTELIRGN